MPRLLLLLSRWWCFFHRLSTIYPMLLFYCARAAFECELLTFHNLFQLFTRNTWLCICVLRDVCTLCTVNHVRNSIVTAAATAAIAHSVHLIGKWRSLTLARCDQFNPTTIWFISRVNDDAQLNSFSFYRDEVYWSIINLHVNACGARGKETQI